MVKSALRDQDNKIEDAIVSLRALSFGDMSERTKALGLDSTTIGNCSALLCESRVTSKLLVNTLVSLVGVFY